MLRYVIIAVLALSVAMLGLTLGIYRTPVGISVLVSLIVLVAGEGLYFIKERPGVALTFTYVAILVLYIIGFSFIRIRPAVPWATQYFLFSSLLLVLPIALNSRITDIGSVLSQLPILISLPTAILGLNGFEYLAILSITPALVTSSLSFICSLMAFVALYLPLIGVPYVVENIFQVPHLGLIDPSPTDPLYSSMLQTLFISIVISLVISSGFANLVRKKLTEAFQPGKIILNSLLLATTSAVFLFSAAGLTVLLLPNAPLIYLLYAIPPGITLAVTVISLIKLGDVMSIVRKLRKEIKEELAHVENRAISLANVLKAFKENEILKDKISKHMEVVEKLSTDIKSIKENLTSSKTSFFDLNRMRKSLERLNDELTDVEEELHRMFKEVINMLQEGQHIIMVYRGRDQELSNELSKLASLESVYDIVPYLSSLDKISIRLCKQLKETSDDTLVHLSSIVGYTLKIEEDIQCDTPYRATEGIKKLISYLKDILSSNKNEIELSYKSLLQLRREIEEIYNNALKEIPSESLVLSTLSSLINELKDVSEITPSLTQAVKIVKQMTDTLLTYHRRLAIAADTDLLKYSKTLNSMIARYLKEGALEPYSPSREYLPYHEAITKSVLNKPYYDIVGALLINLPKMLRMIISEISMLSRSLKRVKYVKIVFDYLDHILSKGPVNIDELPFRKDALEWFLRIYKLYRKDIVVTNGILSSKGMK